MSAANPFISSWCRKAVDNSHIILNKVTITEQVQKQDKALKMKESEYLHREGQALFTGPYLFFQSSLL